MTEEIKRDELSKLMKETDLKKLLSGQECENVVLQMFNFEKVGRGKFFRAHCQNGKVASTKLTFSYNLNKKVIQLENKLPILRITSYQLYNGSFMFVKGFDVLKNLDVLLGSP